MLEGIACRGYFGCLETRPACRDLKHLITLIDDFRKRNIGFKVLTGHGAQIDTTTPNGKMVFGIFARLAEYERELTTERTMAGLKAARASGRPRKMNRATSLMAMSAKSDLNNNSTEIAKRLRMTTTTLYVSVANYSSRCLRYETGFQ